MKFLSQIFSHERSHLPIPHHFVALFVCFFVWYERGFGLRGVDSNGWKVGWFDAAWLVCDVGSLLERLVMRSILIADFYYCMRCTLLQEFDNIIDHLYYWKPMATQCEYIDPNHQILIFVRSLLWLLVSPDQTTTRQLHSTRSHHSPITMFYSSLLVLFMLILYSRVVECGRKGEMKLKRRS